MNRNGWPRFATLVCIGLFLLAPAGLFAQEETTLVLADGLDRAAVERSLQPAGGKLIAWMPEFGAAIVQIPAHAQQALGRDPRLKTFARSSFAPGEDPLEPTAPPLVRAWASLVASSAADPQPPEEMESLHSDLFVGPQWWDNLEGAWRKDAPAGDRPFGADWQNTSEYLAGRVSLNLLLIESNGDVDPESENWTEVLESRIAAEGLEAATNLVALHPGADLSFTIHLHSGRTDVRLETGYEPISRAADPSGTTGEELWSKQVLEQLGYPNGSRLTRSRMLADQTRIDDGTDWAVNVFVINSAADRDGRFLDGRFAYAWLGGPHIVITSDNSTWGLSRFNWVLRHEVHHSFFGLDQYASSRCSCGAASGYLAGTNDNCQNGCGSVVPDVMINNILAASDATRIQVGTYDGDLDGTPDLLAVPPEVTLEPAANLSCNGIVVLSGSATIHPPINGNPGYVTPRRDITLFRISEVQVRVNGGPWQSGLSFPRDGAFDSQNEEFDLSLSLSNGRHQIEVRALDSRGNPSLEASHSVDVAEATQPVGASLRMSHTNNGPTIRWDPAPGALTYLVRLSPRAGEVNQADPYREIAQTAYSDANPGTVFYRVTAVDGCGKETP